MKYYPAKPFPIPIPIYIPFPSSNKVQHHMAFYKMKHEESMRLENSSAVHFEEAIT